MTHTDCDTTLESQRAKIERVRDRMTTIGVLALGCLAVPALIASLVRAADVGWQPVMFLHVGVSLTVLTTAIWHRRLSVRIRSCVLLGTFGIVGIAGLVSWGLIGLGLIYLFATCALVGILYGIRPAVITIAVCVTATLLIGVAVSQGLVSFDFDANRYGVAATSWIHAALVCGFIATITIVIVGRLHNALLDSLNMLEERVERRTAALSTANANLTMEIDKRAQADERIRQLTIDIQHASRLSTMGEMLAGVAHELHQPLTVIANYADGCRRRLARGNVEREEFDNAMERITAESLRAGQIIKRIRTFIRKEEPETSAVDINDVVRDALGLAELPVREQRVTVVEDLSDDLPQVLADRIQIVQVLLNLLLNGIEAMVGVESGQRTLTIRTLAQDDNSVCVEVADAGCGIPSSRVHDIFEQFVTTKRDGLGIGLPISRTIVEAHGGRMWFDSVPQSGSVFRFNLPAIAQTVPTRQIDLPSDLGRCG